jgi:type II secretory pathway component PulJ
MGAAVMLDLIGSVIIGGILLLTLFRMNDNASANTFNFTGELTVQENLVATIEVLEYDFRKIGYCEDPSKIPNPVRAIIFADSTEIVFLTDVDSDGTPDKMRYYLGEASELNGTANPNDRMLYREVNDVPQGVNLGVTQFHIKYFDALGDSMNVPINTIPTGIMSMQIDVTVENTAAYNEEYRYAFWRQIRLASRNLNNR